MRPDIPEPIHKLAGIRRLPRKEKSRISGCGVLEKGPGDDLLRVAAAPRTAMRLESFSRLALQVLREPGHCMTP